MLINNPLLIERAEVIWQKGTNRKAFYRGEVDKYTWVDIGSSFLPSELTAAFLYAQLEHARRINAHRRTLYEKYSHLLTPLEQQGLCVLPAVPNMSPENGHIFYLQCGSEAQRDGLISYLRSQNIAAVFHYVPLHSSPAGIRFGRTVANLPVTDRVSSTLVRLPLFSEMTVEQVKFVCEGVKSFLSHASHCP